MVLPHWMDISKRLAISGLNLPGFFVDEVKANNSTK
jgi:hypothetical protein